MGKPSRPARQVTSKRQKYTVQVYCEGEKTEVQYLNAWYRRCRDRVIVTIDERACGRVPRQLVEEAVKDKQRAERDQKRGRGTAPDAYWCVFDVDEHPDIREAVELAAAHGINVAISNPCIELWLLLHYAEHRKWDHRWDVQAELKGIAGIGKNLSAEHTDFLLENYPAARERAVALEKMHDGNQTDDRNPSSNLYELIDILCDPPAV